jgi:hypothetical protein
MIMNARGFLRTAIAIAAGALVATVGIPSRRAA